MKENQAYHSDASVLSSSMLKMILDDPAKFKHEYLDGNRADSGAAHFVEGTFVHSLILEPEKVQMEYAIFNGFAKRGTAYEDFKSANGDKTILSIVQKERCLQLLEGYKARPEAVGLITGGSAEHTLNSTVLDVPVKCRADYINFEAGYIVDVKTTAEASDSETFKHTVKRFSYDLSAALYIDIAQQVFEKSFDFYWIVLSKEDKMCEVYKASNKTLNDGDAAVKQALRLYTRCKETGIWEHPSKKVDYSTKDYEIREI